MRMTIGDRWETDDVGHCGSIMWFSAQATGKKYAATIYDDGTWVIGDDPPSLYFEGECLSDFITRLQELIALAQSRFGEDWGAD